MVRAGKIRHYGLSNETTWGVCAFRQAAKDLGVPGPVTIQNSYSLVSRSVEWLIAWRFVQALPQSVLADYRATGLSLTALAAFPAIIPAHAFGANSRIAIGAITHSARAKT